MRRYLLLIIAAATLFGSCRKKEDPMRIPYGSLTTTTNYFTTFKGTDSNTTVNFSEETTRIKMMKELNEYLISFGSSTISASKLRDLFNNTNSPYTDTTLKNATGISISSKIAISYPAADAAAEVQKFNDWLDSVASLSVYGQTLASQGVPGTLDYAYLVSAKGFEYGQFIEKGLMGALLLDQMNVMLSPERMAADNTSIVAGKNYTQMEHNWDEAYGCLAANEYYPKQDSKGNWLENYLGNYVRQVNGVYGNPASIYMAFLKGRAAIVNGDIATRDQQIEIIHSTVEKAIATVAVSYLNKTTTASNESSRYHALSEGAGFIYALRFAYNPKINRSKSEELLGKLMNKTDGFWSLTNTEILSVRDELALTFNVDRDAVVNH